MWFKVDDGLPDHPKVEEGLEADWRAHQRCMAAWVMLGAACGKRLNGGRVTASLMAKILPKWPASERQRAAENLVKVGLWDVSGDGDGWCFHDWDRYQPSGVEVKGKRDAKADRQQRWRENKGESGNVDASVDAPNGVSVDASTSASTRRVSRVRAPAGARAPIPDPTRPDLDQKSDPDHVASESPGLGILTRGFVSRWQAKNRDAWPGYQTHRARADRLGEQIDARPDGAAWIESALDGYFASSEPFVLKVRHNFATFASDPGRWVTLAAKSSTPAPRDYHPADHGDLTALGGVYIRRWNLWVESGHNRATYDAEMARRRAARDDGPKA